MRAPCLNPPRRRPAAAIAAQVLVIVAIGVAGSRAPLPAAAQEPAPAVAPAPASAPAPAPTHPPAPPPAPVHPVEVHYQAAVAAAGRADWPAYLAAIDSARALAPGQPVLERRRAEALAQLGRGDEAQAVLLGLAGWGVGLKLDDNPLLAPLRARADWPAVGEAMAAALRPRGLAVETFAVPVDDLVPEGLAWDPVTDTFYLGSVAQRRIVRVTRAGLATTVCGPAEHGYLAGLGLAVDAQRRRLWAVSTAPAQDARFTAAESGTSAVHVFDLDSGGLLWSAVSPAADGYGLNDVCVLPDGAAALSASDAGLVVRCEFGGAGVGAPLCARGAVPGANGLCVGPDGRTLYVSAYGLGIMRVDPGTGAVTPATVPGAAFTTMAVDGLYAVPGGLVAVQNFLGLDRVARFSLRADGLLDGCRVLAARRPEFAEPTTGAVAGDGFHFIADSRVTAFFERDERAPLTGFGRAHVERVGLD